MHTEIARSLASFAQGKGVTRLGPLPENTPRLLYSRRRQTDSSGSQARRIAIIGRRIDSISLSSSRMTHFPYLSQIRAAGTRSRRSNCSCQRHAFSFRVTASWEGRLERARDVLLYTRRDVPNLQTWRLSVTDNPTPATSATRGGKDVSHAERRS